MAGTYIGGIKARETNKKKFGNDFYALNGAKGGAAKVRKGFGTNPELASKAGAKGGKISRRGPAKK